MKNTKGVAAEISSGERGMTTEEIKVKVEVTTEKKGRGVMTAILAEGGVEMSTRMKVARGATPPAVDTVEEIETGVLQQRE